MIFSGGKQPKLRCALRLLVSSVLWSPWCSSRAATLRRPSCTCFPSRRGDSSTSPSCLWCQTSCRYNSVTVPLNRRWASQFNEIYNQVLECWGIAIFLHITYYFIKLSSGKESLLCIMSAPLCDWRDICHVLVNADGVNLVWQLRCSLRCNLRSLDTKTIYYVYYSSISSNLVYLYLMNDNESPIGVTRPSIIFTVFVLCWIHRAVSELKC